jgi:hypothetical protein
MACTSLYRPCKLILACTISSAHWATCHSWLIARWLVATSRGPCSQSIAHVACAISSLATSRRPCASMSYWPCAISSLATSRWLHSSVLIGQLATSRWLHSSVLIGQLATSRWLHSSVLIGQLATSRWLHSSVLIGQLATSRRPCASMSYWPCAISSLATSRRPCASMSYWPRAISWQPSAVCQHELPAMWYWLQPVAMCY